MNSLSYFTNGEVDVQVGRKRMGNDARSKAVVGAQQGPSLIAMLQHTADDSLLRPIGLIVSPSFSIWC